MISARGTAFQTIRFKQKTVGTGVPDGPITVGTGVPDGPITVGTGVPDGPIYETELQYIQIIREKETETWLTLRRIK